MLSENLGRSSRLEGEYPWDFVREDISTLLDRIQTDDPLRSVRRAASRSIYRGHRSLDEASKTFDLALSALQFSKTPLGV